MTARAQLTPVQLVQDGAVAQGSGDTIAASSPGVYIADPPGPFKILLVVTSTVASAQNVTVRAGGNGNTESGGANPGVPFEQATVGDLVVSVPADGTQFIGPFTTDRFTQADGALYVDFAAAFTGSIVAYQLPMPALQA
jgi:hypothetical protein